MYKIVNSKSFFHSSTYVFTNSASKSKLKIVVTFLFKVMIVLLRQTINYVHNNIPLWKVPHDTKTEIRSNIPP